MKKVITLVAAFAMCVTLSESMSMTTYACSNIPTISALTIAPRAEIIEWRYKIVGDKLYRRQYNCTKSCWIGSWELVG